MRVNNLACTIELQNLNTHSPKLHAVSPFTTKHKKFAIEALSLLKDSALHLLARQSEQVKKLCSRQMRYVLQFYVKNCELSSEGSALVRRDIPEDVKIKQSVQKEKQKLQSANVLIEHIQRKLLQKQQELRVKQNLITRLKNQVAAFKNAQQRTTMLNETRQLTPGLLQNLQVRPQSCQFQRPSKSLTVEDLPQTQGYAEEICKKSTYFSKFAENLEFEKLEKKKPQRHRFSKQLNKQNKNEQKSVNKFEPTISGASSKQRMASAK